MKTLNIPVVKESQENINKSDFINQYEKDSLKINKNNDSAKYYKNAKKDNTITYYLEKIRNYDLLTFEEEKELSRRIQEENDTEALNKLINSNLRLVVKIAKNYISSGYPFIDIIQDGNIGLMKAASKYDYRKNVRFSTYASWWIKQTIIRSLSVKKRIIRLSHRKEEKLRRIKKARNLFYQKNKDYPSYEELSEILNIPVKEIKDILSVSHNVVSIEDNLSEDQNFTIENTIGDDSYIPETILENETLTELTEKIMEALIPRERMIISLRYGLNKDNKKYTLKNMGEMFGISAETVRQIEIRALKKLRAKYPHLKDFLY
ncbi:MAG: sigma-70 family RNA polymerase sigma factor [bacterium]